jgi:CubicO group peptidase (beta-lactamase class C family)
MRLIVAVVLAALSSSLAAAPPADFDARVESLRARIGVPGLAIAIVENGEATLARGYGVKKFDAPERVDADTIFPTGSTGKAFTVAALATLVDAGKISWDDKVIDRLPGFQMYDPWVTREITIRDLLVHRSGLGLGAGDLLMVPRGSISRAEAVKRLRYIKPATSFRSSYAYDNVLYMVAGQLIEAVTGQTWENYVREHVLAPVGMSTSTSDSDRRFATANRAQPHARPGRVRGTGPQQLLDERDELGRAGAPAGGLAISANDMPESLTLAEPMFQAYALGWGVRDYRGTKIISHGGAVLGFQSVVTLIPSKNIGIAIEINSEDGEIVLGLMYELLDHYLGFSRNDWPEKYSAFKQERLAGALQALESTSAKPVGARVGPSLPLARYAGTYADPWYGNIELAVRDGALTIDFKPTPRMAGTLQHWQYDTFVTRLDDKTIEPAYVTFGLDAEGKVERITMKPVSPLADFSYDYQDLSFAPVKKP